MTEHKWKARTKRDLMIEVWESLDCESVGASELKAIQNAVRKRFGEGAVESPASVARVLADEGAELRHPEVLELDVEQRLSDPYAEMFRGASMFEDLDKTTESIRKLEELRNTFITARDKTGLRRVRDFALKSKRDAQVIGGNNDADEHTRSVNKEIVEWLTLWLQQPEVFEVWLDLRRSTSEFHERFQKR